MKRCSKCKKESDRPQGTCTYCYDYYRRYYKLHKADYRRWNNESAKRWRSRNPELVNKRNREANKVRRLKALRKIGGEVLACISCGCDDLRILEINHKNLGGTQEYKRHSKSFPRRIVSDIIMKRRGVDDLEILCRVCNSKHYVEKKYGIKRFDVKWRV